MKCMGAEIEVTERGPIADKDINSCICGKLLHAWASLAKDPGANVARWTWEGALGGIRNSFNEWEHLLPSADAGEPDPIASVSSEYDEFVNYSGIEQDDDIASSIDGYISSDFLQAFDNLEDCKEYVGGDRILSK